MQWIHSRHSSHSNIIRTKLPSKVVKDDLMRTKECPLMAMCVCALIRPQAYKLILAGQAVTKYLRLTFEEVVVLGVENQAWCCDLLTQPFQSILFSCPHQF